MIKRKKLFTLYYLYLVFLGFGTSSLHAGVVGYGYSDAVLPKKNQELFFLGFELGFKEKYKGKNPSDLVLTHSSIDGSALGAVSSAKELLKLGSKIIVGFPTSHEALLASQVAIENKTLFIAAAAGHMKLAQSGEYVYTTGEQIAYDAVETLKFIKSKFSNKNGFVISNPKSVFSTDYAKNLRAKYKDKDFESVKLDFYELNSELLLTEDQIRNITLCGDCYIVITHYADESGPLLKQFDESKIDMPILSNSSWTTGDIELIRRYLAYRKQPIYSFTLWLKGSKESKEFEKLLKKRFGREPVTEISFGYDLGVVTAETLNRVQGPYTKESIFKAFVDNLCFDNTSSGRICFTKNGGHAERKIYFVQFYKDGGFLPVKER
jgi:ABC-type branched-subunit amino acid transport system substrate-binding protein